MGVWVGNADGEGRPELTGVKAASPLMFSIFELLPYNKPFQSPLGERRSIKICSASGFKAGPNCERLSVEELPENGDKSMACPYHQIINLDAEENYQVNSSCYSVGKMIQRKWFVLPPAEAWYFKQYNSSYSEPPEFHPMCNVVASKNEFMELIYPRHFTKLFIPTELDGTPGAAIFEIAHKNKVSTVYWHLNGQYLGNTREAHQMHLHPEKGSHSLHLVDDQGRELNIAFEVISEKRM